MRITSWNFLHGQSLSAESLEESQQQLQGALADLAPDLIAFQEVDYKLARSQSKNQMKELATLMGAKYWAFAPTLQGTPGVQWKKLDKENQVVICESSDTNAHEFQIEGYGIGIVSTVPVRKWLRLELGKSVIGAPLAVANQQGKMRLMHVKDEPRVALAAVLENGLTVINVHLSFIPLFNIYQLFKVTRWAKRIARDEKTRTILLGDFNLIWGIPSKVTRWKRASQALSYPAWGPKISFDYILYRGSDCLEVKEIDVGPLPISDHRAISAEINPA
jgi:endonuclease/exonuclease/phosphatase family metal-dependent hydrolase